MKNNTNKTIFIGYTELKISLPIFVAEQEGLFLKHKLDNVKLQKYDNAQLLMEDIASHKIHLGGYLALPIAFSVMHKTELIFIGGIYENNEYPISFLLKNKNNKNIQCIKDLKGKKIGILPTNAYKVWLETILLKADLKLTDIDITEVPIGKQKNSLENNDLDALFTNDPIASEIILKGIGIRLSEEALVPKATGIDPFYFGSFNVTTQYAKAHQPIIRKLTLALDEAILLIGKNPYIVEKALKKYLPNSTKELIDQFSKTLFKTSKSISNHNLEIMQLYYYQQNLYTKNISIHNLQYQYTGKIYRLKKFKNKVIDFLEKNWKILGVISAVVVLITTNVIKYYNHKEEQIKQQKERLELRKSQQAQFKLDYTSHTTYSEPIKLVNIGSSSLKNIKIQIEIYFISNTYEIYAASNLQNITASDKNLLNKFRKTTNIVKEPSDFEGLFDTKRIYTLTSLEGNIFDVKSNENQMDLDLGSFSQINAIKINKILKMQIIIRLKIKYNEEISGILRTAKKYIWFDKDEDNQTIRRDLEDVYGGKKIIETITHYEDNTRDSIFKK